MEAYIFLEDN